MSQTVCWPEGNLSKLDPDFAGLFPGLLAYDSHQDASGHDSGNSLNPEQPTCFHFKRFGRCKSNPCGVCKISPMVREKPEALKLNLYRYIDKQCPKCAIHFFISACNDWLFYLITWSCFSNMGHDHGKYPMISMITNLSDIIVTISYFLDFPLFQMSLFDPRFDDDWVPHKWLKNPLMAMASQYIPWSSHQIA